MKDLWRALNDKDINEIQLDIGMITYYEKICDALKQISAIFTNIEKTITLLLPDGFYDDIMINKYDNFLQRNKIITKIIKSA